ncbi:uncharacterized protein [Palaemon carinicauda]|uniref:uncharacterized protein n=1 Tax=Palaemon carinicauda TaxID=392227 RepID=UPI0035B6093E
MPVVTTKTVFAVGLVVFAVFQMGYGLKCYSGVDDLMIEIPCIGGSCLRDEINSQYGDAVSYDCYPRKVAENCTTYLLGGDSLIECFCNTDLCNSSGVTTLALPLLLGSLLLKLFM